eukprot:4285397-Prymnesium_polylepis.1
MRRWVRCSHRHDGGIDEALAVLHGLVAEVGVQVEEASRTEPLAGLHAALGACEREIEPCVSLAHGEWQRRGPCDRIVLTIAHDGVEWGPWHGEWQRAMAHDEW